ncbi:hypothetical protein KC19_1G019300 [Ceratodon purpureus]|uniref:Uncharacterized protein n=1 Tax=Ceratodon purpureus TaxID=3225 RepID=A0A8T0J2G0_CERPU|nr:hypothetical protein KC19_1G019300 [Ceratodon purpureus]
MEMQNGKQKEITSAGDDNDDLTYQCTTHGIPYRTVTIRNPHAINAWNLTAIRHRHTSRRRSWLWRSYSSRSGSPTSVSFLPCDCAYTFSSSPPLSCRLHRWRESRTANLLQACNQPLRKP